jgi:Terminase small subunit
MSNANEAENGLASGENTRIVEGSGNYGASHLPALAETPRKAPSVQRETLPDLPPIEGLTPLQSAFVRHYVQQGGRNGKVAAMRAGYSPLTAAQAASRMLDHPEIVAAITKETTLAIGRHVPLALGTMARLARSARSEFVQQNAAADLLNRAGIGIPSRAGVPLGGGVLVKIDLG